MTWWSPTSPGGAASAWRPTPRRRPSASPDWVCEILSPSTRRFDLTDKRAVYAVHGACHLWLLDPVGETLEAFALREGAWLLLGTAAGDGEVRLPPFEAVGFSLSTLWS
ncbi:MAG TPA: Uma2 family endonuclease [Amaricoccus sp.]|nr:Uma2 family endonuclease [Amaricoccus sp.]